MTAIGAPEGICALGDCLIDGLFHRCSKDETHRIAWSLRHGNTVAHRCTDKIAIGDLCLEIVECVDQNPVRLQGKACIACPIQCLGTDEQDQHGHCNIGEYAGKDETGIT
jgi:hypothetical protein